MHACNAWTDGAALLLDALVERLDGDGSFPLVAAEESNRLSMSP
jgi:hypothetical protein